MPDSGGVTFVPALAGLGAPHWNPHARGLISGLDRGVTRGHIARAALEGIALQNAGILDAMVADSGVKLSGLKVDGGAAANNLLMQYQADILGVPIVRPRMLETTALGAALLAGLGVGLWSNTDEAKAAWQKDRTFSPSMNDAERQVHLDRWNSAVGKA